MKTQKTLWIAASLISATCFADIGTELNAIMNEQGKPAFGVQYVYDVDAAWTVVYATTLTSEALASLPETLQMNVVDVKTGVYLDSWKPIPKSSLIHGTTGINSRSVLTQLLPNQGSLAIVFAVQAADQKPEPKFHLNLGKLCQSYPDSFVDLTRGRKGCDVKASDLPAWDSECKELASQLLDYLKRGLGICQIARDKYLEDGCGELSCK
jgi:hypothetical protein